MPYEYSQKLGEKNLQTNKNKISRYLVTGSSGFIASHVIEELVKRGYEPVLIDNNCKNLKRFDFDYSPYEVHCLDIRDYHELDKVIKTVDGVIHLAAILGTPETFASFGAIRNTADVNIMGSLNVFESVKNAKIPCVYIQTGNGKNLSPYPITKDCAAEFALAYNKEFGTKIAVIRGLVAYGERQKHSPVKKIFPTFIYNALLGNNIEINGNGAQSHDFIYVKDLATVLIDALTIEHNIYDRVIDGGSGYVYSVNTIAELIKKKVHSKSTIVHETLLPNGNVRMGEPANDTILSGESRNLIKTYNHRKVEDVLDQIIEWYKKYYI